jgi:hypothetical protein
MHAASLAPAVRQRVSIRAPLPQLQFEMTLTLVIAVGVAICVLYILRKCTNFRDAVYANIRVGGDSCARALLLGAFYTASHYPLSAKVSFWSDNSGDKGAIPLGWLEKCADAEINEVLADCSKVATNPLLPIMRLLMMVDSDGCCSHQGPRHWAIWTHRTCGRQEPVPVPPLQCDRCWGHEERQRRLCCGPTLVCEWRGSGADSR